MTKVPELRPQQMIVVPRESGVSSTPRLLGSIAGASPCAFGVLVRVDMQHDPRNVAPVGAILVGIKQTEIRDNMLLVIRGKQWTGRRQIGDIRIEWWLFHGHSRDGRDTQAAYARQARSSKSFA
jgi:hypothetical protein